MRRRSRMKILILASILGLYGCNNTMKIREYKKQEVYSLTDQQLIDYATRLREQIALHGGPNFQADRIMRFKDEVNFYQSKDANQYVALSLIDRAGMSFASYVDKKIAEGYVEDLYVVKSEIEKRKRQASVLEHRQEDGQNVIEGKEAHALGESSFSVEKKAREDGCNKVGTADLVYKDKPNEVYRVQCDDGAILYRCLYRQCSVMTYD